MFLREERALACCRNSHLQFPRSPLETLGLAQPPKKRQRKRTACNFPTKARVKLKADSIDEAICEKNHNFGSYENLLEVPSYALYATNALEFDIWLLLN